MLLRIVGLRIATTERKKLVESQNIAVMHKI
jgi:hypothetical protein